MQSYKFYNFTCQFLEIFGKVGEKLIIQLSLTSDVAYLMGISLIISLFMEGETSVVQWLGNMGSGPRSLTFLSSSQRLKDSRGAKIPDAENKAQDAPS